MRIYIAHSREFDFQNELCAPLRKSALNGQHEFVLPHENSDAPSSSKEFFQNGCDLVIAEVSFPSTGLGIELGWANMLKVPMACISKTGSKVTVSLNAVCDSFYEYSDANDLITKIEAIILKQETAN